MTRKITPAQLDEIEAATIRKQVVHAAINGEPDKRFATTLALVAEVRELRGKVERTRTQAQQVLNKHSDGPYGVGAADQAYLTIKALGEEA